MIFQRFLTNSRLLLTIVLVANCQKLDNPCEDYSLHDCDKNAICLSAKAGYFECKCPSGFIDKSTDNRFPGRICRKEEDECNLGTHNCDPNADCVDLNDGYSCRCRQGWQDVSPNRLNTPGRACKKVDQCANVECAINSNCRETPNGPICQCRLEYADVSLQSGLQQGRICVKLVNECQENKDDCSQNSDCIDTSHGSSAFDKYPWSDSFTCRCHDGFRDESPDLLSRPGRVCVQTTAPDPPECEVNDPLSCDQAKSEVCIFIEGTYKCKCPSGFGRLPDGRCLVLNECSEPRLNDCHVDHSQCFDQADGYTCQCLPGFADVSSDVRLRPGRICRRLVDECRSADVHSVDCHRNAICVDTDESFACRCRPGFVDISDSYNELPGRNCVPAVNECLDPTLNDCAEQSICEDAKEDYTCRCRPGFVDASPNITHYFGRICNKPKNKLSVSLDQCHPNASNCARNEVCLPNKQGDGTNFCQCAENAFRFEDGSCRLFSACEKGNDCAPNAICSNAFDTFSCQCKPGHFDISPDPIARPGRICKELVNECANRQHDCSPFSTCIDTRYDYACMCNEGYLDTSSQYGILPGRRCRNSSNECVNRRLHTCDPNADCVDTVDGYTCQCFAGFVDVSTSARLPPGRVCTVETTCPKQATDLMFLIDGSGSIGSRVFKNEVLRFVREFVELFDIGVRKTRVGVIQYSDQIRHEFDLGQHRDNNGVRQAIDSIQYLTGLTRTGAAIRHMVTDGFATRRGARPESDTVARVAIVITDGRSQDNVSKPALLTISRDIQVFAIGVTDHVLASELEQIAGSSNRWFFVDHFRDLDTRLRSIIQKAACPSPIPKPTPPGPCNPTSQTGCNRARNEVCVQHAGTFSCVCPDTFLKHPLTRICGGDVCNPQLLTSCPDPAECKITPFGNYRCSCPSRHVRDSRTGFCVSIGPLPPPIFPNTDQCRLGNDNDCPQSERCVQLADNSTTCRCLLGLQRNPKNGICGLPGSCDPTLADNPCDPRKHEQCRPHTSGGYYTCQCPANHRRHPVTKVCLFDECAGGVDDCSSEARCIDTDDGFLCTCRSGHLDRSPDLQRKPGRVCVQEQNECTTRNNNCSRDARCIDTVNGYLCECNQGFVDFSPNPKLFGGVVCQKMVNECANSSLNNCHRNAFCIDTVDSYKCVCKARFVDTDDLRNPGRNCVEVQLNDRCSSNDNDCDPNALCIPQGAHDYHCSCPAGYRDKSPDSARNPGRVCIPLIPECDNPSLNDCDSPDRALCIDTDDGYLCRCRQGFLDISKDISSKQGRLCKPLENECLLATDDCARIGGICEDTPDSYTCRCSVNYLDVSFDRRQRPGRQCKRLINECNTGQNDCSPSATCTDTEDSFICACPADFVDVSPERLRLPGRRCLRRQNECLSGSHDCSPNADCIDSAESFRCKCRDDFVDESPDVVLSPGRVCRPVLVDECRLGQHDCSIDAVCTDQPSRFDCRCREGFLDESPNRITRPGRVCKSRPTPQPDECRVDTLSSSCNLDLNEVCRIVGGRPKCACPLNYRRHPTSGACTVINECLFPSLNNCDHNAVCNDEEDGYSCTCLPGFKDKSAELDRKTGRICQLLVNECALSHLNDCHQNAICKDLDDDYSCQCRDTYLDLTPQTPGRICRKVVDECADPSLNSCDRNAQCEDRQEGYECRCLEDYFDVSPSIHLRGRACRQVVNECADPTNGNDCHQSATCIDTLDSYHCECPANSRDISPNAAFPGRVCLVFENECLTDKHDCDPNAMCHDNEESFTCECPREFTDHSPNARSRPGRVCVRLVDECRLNRHTCSVKAECRDLQEGYTCECIDGYVDRSPDLRTQPGRVCGVPEVCPPNHACSSAAICEPLGGKNYKCTCIQGYVDQSTGGDQGRICVRAAACSNKRLNDCSENANCTDGRESGTYRCQCLADFVDFGARQGTMCLPDALHSNDANLDTTTPSAIDNECRDPRLNNCSRNAICYDLPQGYRCECIRGFVDRSPDTKFAGRICEFRTEPTRPPRHPCQDPLLNDCHPAGTCAATGGNSYTCSCLPGYADQSTDLPQQPGRICVLTQPICLDRSRNDCHPAAICSETSTPARFTCRCRDGYADESPQDRPGRQCVEEINECLDRALNDCHPKAVCHDMSKGFTCRCPLGAVDQSDDPTTRPGRKCLEQVNECDNPLLNDCSRFADCADTTDGYQCRCRSGYNDNDPVNPGTVCVYVINECESDTLNDCSRHAVCVDQPGGYTCRCRPPYTDESPRDQPGRICRFDECLDPKFNECHRNAVCQDTSDGFICHCKEGFYDNSTNPLLPGRICISFIIEPTTVTPLLPPDLIRCGPVQLCQIALNQVCIGGRQCGCRPGQSRRDSDNLPCTVVDSFTLAFRIVRRGRQSLVYSSEYGNRLSPRYVEIVHRFVEDMHRTVGGTEYAQRYVTTQVDYITHPKTVNSSWPDGLLVNFSIKLEPGRPRIDICNLWHQLMNSLERSNGLVGAGQMLVASDLDLLDPCRPVVVGPECAPGLYCNSDLGEVCIARSICGCPLGQKQTDDEQPCRQVDAWVLPLWVVRHDRRNLVYNDSFGDPLHPLNGRYVQLFETGIPQCYQRTQLAGTFVTMDVNDIYDPQVVNATWDTGLMYNFTCYFRRGSIRLPSDVFTMLVEYIVLRNGLQIGTSGLYIDTFQSNPFRPCFRNNCHPKGVCFDLGPNAYRCRCGPGYRDLNPSDPGRNCLPNFGYNECERSEDNECSPDARCIDREHLYECQCLPNFVDVSLPGDILGSHCVLDYCSDVHFCPTNTTCVNEQDQAVCSCDPGFVDIRLSERRSLFGIPRNSYCMRSHDVDECSLDLTNCSGVAECTDLPVDYQCRCPSGYIDGNVKSPGRICAALLCDLCHGHGDCIHDRTTQNITCSCQYGWMGEFCNVAPSDTSLILLIILAILFLLLTVCCCLYFCLKCRCVRGRNRLWYRQPLFTYRKNGAIWPWSTLEASNSSDSGAADFSSAAGGNTHHDYYPELGIPRAKLKPMSVRDQLDVRHLTDYLDQQQQRTRIPRVRLSGSADRDESVIVSDVNRGHPADSYESTSTSGSDTSSEYTMRKVTTDINMKETRRTTTTVAGGRQHETTAQFHVYPPVEDCAVAEKKNGRFDVLGGVKKEVSKRWQKLAGSQREDHGCMDEADRDMTTLYESGQYNGKRSDIFNSTVSEQNRGQSIAEFSVGNLQNRETDWTDTATEFSQNRAMSEYTERDFESYVSEASCTGTEIAEEYDKKELVKNNREWRPDSHGKGGTECYSQVSSKKIFMKETNRY